MANPVHPAVRLRMQMVSGGLLAGALLFLAVGYFVQVNRSEPSGLLVLSYLACLLAVLSPLEVALVEQVRKPSGDPFVDHLVGYALFEAAAVFCGMALVAGANPWPLLAAAVPVGAMILRFPRGA